MDHEWRYKDALSSPSVVPFAFVARDAREGDEPFTPVVEWDPDDYSAEDDVAGHVIDACAAEILRLAERVRELEAGLLDFHEEIAALEEENRLLKAHAKDCARELREIAAVQPLQRMPAFLSVLDAAERLLDPPVPI